MERWKMGARVQTRQWLVDCFIGGGIRGTIVDSRPGGHNSVIYAVQFDDRHYPGWTDEDRLEKVDA